jgi:hypothetical protein
MAGAKTAAPRPSLRTRIQDVWATRKKELFFFGVAVLALSQIFAGEYRLRQRKALQDRSTPQQLNRVKVIEATKNEVNPYGMRSEWKK